MRRKWFISLAFAAFAAGCGNGDGSNDDDDTGDSGDTDVVGSPDGISPWVESALIDCGTIGGSANVPTWFMEVSANDPQGPDTIKSFGHSIKAYTTAGGLIFDKPYIVCTDSGFCDGTWKEEQHPEIICANADSFNFTVSIFDDNDNSSVEFPFSWE